MIGVFTTAQFFSWRRGHGTEERKFTKQKDMQRRSVSLTVNGKVHELEMGNTSDQVDPAHTLAFTLRETLGLTGTKIACDGGACGCCTVLMDGKAVLSCMTLTIECNGKNVTTIEGLSDRERRTRSASAGICR